MTKKDLLALSKNIQKIVDALARLTQPILLTKAGENGTLVSIDHQAQMEKLAKLFCVWKPELLNEKHYSGLSKYHVLHASHILQQLCKENLNYSLSIRSATSFIPKFSKTSVNVHITPTIASDKFMNLLENHCHCDTVSSNLIEYLENHLSPKVFKKAMKGFQQTVLIGPKYISFCRNRLKKHCYHILNQNISEDDFNKKVKDDKIKESLITIALIERESYKFKKQQKNNLLPFNALARVLRATAARVPQLNDDEVGVVLVTVWRVVAMPLSLELGILSSLDKQQRKQLDSLISFDYRNALEELYTFHLKERINSLRFKRFEKIVALEESVLNAFSDFTKLDLDCKIEDDLFGKEVEASESQYNLNKRVRLSVRDQYGSR
eukprot:CAMPEP_0168604128 /NCGR_PEP_ID=MMETSP0420-20121227/15123_1 /TAXON_ID=498008 /ORGANISM="Pessonella sp." /LENGTH=379 /DNA_ID=CAMNT_0008643207 /DNA_START=497 /DNA_END=1633 /DNA_ORIENTATION=-